LHQGIEWSGLPRTFQDAVEVVRALRIPYLWIDSLCIIEDGDLDGEDWNLHIREMEKIYKNCYLNISASFAENSSGGRFQDRLSGLMTPCIAKFDSEVLVMEVERFGAIGDFYLTSRAW
jgi:hypothetical protein